MHCNIYIWSLTTAASKAFHDDDDGSDDCLSFDNQVVDDCLSFDSQVVGERTFISQAQNWSESLQTVGPEPAAGAWYLLIIIIIIILIHCCDPVEQAGEAR